MQPDTASIVTTSLDLFGGWLQDDSVDGRLLFDARSEHF